MRIIRHKNLKDKDVVEVYLDEDNNFQEIEGLEYAVYLTIEELENINNDFVLETGMFKALKLGIEVYSAQQTLKRITVCEKKLLESGDFVYAFRTTDESKFKELENIVKDFCNEIKKMTE